jgi:hypothetical protein
MNHQDLREPELGTRAMRPDPGPVGDRADADGAVERHRATQSVIDRAHERDQLADVRDDLADARDTIASLDTFLHDENGNVGIKARRFAALDRLDAKADRASAADDRAKLRR